MSAANRIYRSELTRKVVLSLKIWVTGDSVQEQDETRAYEDLGGRSVRVFFHRGRGVVRCRRRRASRSS
jgi:hypothetical protein